MSLLDAFKPVALTPVCSWCSRIRTGPGEWRDTANPNLRPGAPDTSTCICPDCRHKHYAQPNDNAIRYPTRL